MTMTMLAWLIALPLLGVVTGMRSMLPMAVLCLFAYRGHLPVDDSWAAWTASRAALATFMVLAIGELIADKLPKTPNRTALVPLLVRLGLGGLLGAIVATALDGDIVEGVMLGLGGALLGAYGGYQVRKELVQRGGWKDWHVALAEDALAITWAFLSMGVVTG
jgi:uncharacterized membrane protein